MMDRRRSDDVYEQEDEGTNRRENTVPLLLFNYYCSVVAYYESVA
jgi:hypothetical protein